MTTGLNYEDYGLIPTPGQQKVSAYKQGHKCCGGCCDVRRAVIIVNIINASLSLLMLSFNIMTEQVLKDSEKNMDQMPDFFDSMSSDGNNNNNNNAFGYDSGAAGGWDGSYNDLNANVDDQLWDPSFSKNMSRPEYQPTADDFHKAERMVGWLIFFLLIQVVTNGIGVYGAYQYIKWAVAVSALVYSLSIFKAIFVGFDPISLILHGCFLYPHLYLLKEMHEGIMTAENYINEEFSCCCV